MVHSQDTPPGILETMNDKYTDQNSELLDWER
jgi:hypothetical protein